MTRVTKTNPFESAKSMLSMAFTNRGRGEIGKHKGLKKSAFSGLITRVPFNLFNNNKNLIDKISVAKEQGSHDLCPLRDHNQPINE